MLLKANSDNDKKSRRRSQPSSQPKHTVSASIPRKAKTDDDADYGMDSARSFTHEAEVFDTALDNASVTKKQAKQIWDSCSGVLEVDFRHRGALAEKVLDKELKVSEILKLISADKKLSVKFSAKFSTRETLNLSELLKFIPEFVENKLCFDLLSYVMPEGTESKSSFAKNMLIDIFRLEQKLNAINQFFATPVKFKKGSFSLWPFVYREILPKAATGIAAAASKSIGSGVVGDYLLPLIFISSSIIGLRFKSNAKKIDKKVSQFKEKYEFLGQLLNLCYVIGLIENKGGVYVAKPELKDVDLICARVWERVQSRFGISSFKYFEESFLLRFQLAMKISLIKYLLRWREEEQRLKSEGVNLADEFKFESNISSLIIDKFEDLIVPVIVEKSFFGRIFGNRYSIKQVLATSAFDKAILEAQAILIRNESRKQSKEEVDSNPSEKRTSRAEAQSKVVAESLIYGQLISTFGIFKTEALQIIYRVDESGKITSAKDKILSDIMQGISAKLSGMEGTKSRYRAPFWISVLAGYLKGEAFAQVNKNLRKLSFLSPLLAFMGSAVYIINNFLKKLTDILDGEYNKFANEYETYKKFLKFLHTNNMLNVSYETDSRGISTLKDVEIARSIKLITRILSLTWYELAEDKIKPAEWINKNYSAKDQAFLSLRLLNGMSHLIKDSVPTATKLRMEDKYLLILAKRFAEEIRGVSSQKWKDKIIKFTLKTAITSGVHAKEISVWINDELSKQGKALSDFYVPLSKSTPNSPENKPEYNKKAQEFIKLLRAKTSKRSTLSEQALDKTEGGSISSSQEAPIKPEQNKIKGVTLLKIPKLPRGGSFIAGYNEVRMPTASTAIAQQTPILPSLVPKVEHDDAITRSVTRKKLFQEIFNRGKEVGAAKKSPRKGDSMEAESKLEPAQYK